jgi:hypothetical protein
MRTTTRRTTSLRIFGALLVLGVLWVSVPGVRADDPIDRVNETGQYHLHSAQFERHFPAITPARPDLLESVRGGIDAQQFEDLAGGLR